MLGAPPAFVLSQDRTLRPKKDFKVNSKMDSRNSWKTGAWGVSSLKPPYKKKPASVRLHDLCDIRSIRFSGFACAANGCGAGMNYTRASPLLASGIGRFTKGTQINHRSAGGGQIVEMGWRGTPQLRVSLSSGTHPTSIRASYAKRPALHTGKAGRRRI